MVQVWFGVGILWAAAIVQPAYAAPMHGGSQPGCQLRLELNPGQWIVSNYNPFGSAHAGGDFDALFVNDGEGMCTFSLTTDTAAAPYGLTRSGNGTRVAYSLIDVSSGDDLTPTTGQSRKSVSQRHWSVPSHGQQLIKLHFEATEPFAGDGLYQQQLVVKAESYDGENLAERPVSLGVQIEPQATIAMSGAFRRVNGQADVDLGVLEPGYAKIPLELLIRSTRAYVVTSESANDGKLRIAGTGWEIPYNLVFAGRSVSPNGGIYNGSLNGSSSVDHLDLGFDIGETAGKAGGVYSDVVTISISVR
jgi:hypothetical protein